VSVVAGVDELLDEVGATKRDVSVSKPNWD